MSLQFEPVFVEKLPEDTRKAMEKELLQASRERREVNPLAWGAVPKRGAGTTDSDDGSDIFSANDLTLDMLPQGREYVVPGTTKKLFIFGITSADTQLMMEWSLTAENLHNDPRNPLALQFANAKYIQDLKLSQVALCCRKGPHRDAPRIFGREDIPALRSRLGSSTVEEIVRISSELSGSDEALGAGVRRFFGSAQKRLKTWLSQCATWEGCPPGLLAEMTQFLSLVTRASSRGKLDSGLLTDLTEWEVRWQGEQGE